MIYEPTNLKIKHVQKKTNFNENKSRKSCRPKYLRGLCRQLKESHKSQIYSTTNNVNQKYPIVSILETFRIIKLIITDTGIKKIAHTLNIFMLNTVPKLNPVHKFYLYTENFINQNNVN